jgi:hypothetical protein
MFQLLLNIFGRAYETCADILLAEIPGSTHRVFPTRYDEEDYADRGSAERDEGEDNSNIVIPTLGPPALGTHHTYTENQVPIPPARAAGQRPILSGSPSLQQGQVLLLAIAALLFVRVMHGV